MGSAKAWQTRSGVAARVRTARRVVVWAFRGAPCDALPLWRGTKPLLPGWMNFAKYAAINGENRKRRSVDRRTRNLQTQGQMLEESRR